MFFKSSTKIIAVAVAVACSAVTASAETISVFGDYSSSRVQLAAELVAQGHTVTESALLPGDLSSFDTIWHIGAFVPLTAGEQALLGGFLADGKGVYLTGERPCCDALNDSLGSLLNANLAAPGVQIGSLGDISGPFSYNPTALGNIGSGISGWVPSAPGGIAGVSGDNVLVTSDSVGTVVAAAWEDSDFTNGGRAVVFMDVNWLQSIDSDEQGVIAATQEFLFDGFVGPNPPNPSAVPLPAGGILLLSGLGALIAGRRFRKAN